MTPPIEEEASLSESLQSEDESDITGVPSASDQRKKAFNIKNQGSMRSNLLKK